MQVNEDMYEADSFYTFNKVQQPWKKKGKISTGALLPASETQVFWLHVPSLSEPVDIHAVKEDVLSALPTYIQQDYTIAIAPFDLGINKCAVIQDSSGRRICLIERINTTRVVS